MEELIEIAHGMNDKNIALDSTLIDLAKLIHEISVYQVAPESNEDLQSNNEIKQLSELYSPETLQLLYQIVINGKKDIYLAPDLLTGFNTTLLRMLAFFPSLQTEKLESKLVRKKSNAPESTDRGKKKLSN